MILGAVLAGGMSTRFGSDKALAVLDGRSLLERAVEALAQLCDKVVIVGRTEGPETLGVECVPDTPRPGMGPLGGVAGALNHARDQQFASVLTTSVDSVGLPQNLLELLSPASAYLEKQPVIGHWNIDAASIAERILQSEGRHSMIAFAKAANARGVQSASTPANINTPADLAALEH
ncbi:molybdenum cofactor guanylyltransferase [Aurantiacibacter suaedae]|uniref:molybdenum cofactor guanylyltransferase n=1 Tax=Aurantiacibacter suaedae TaxID=2545755 RepID=UPI0010F67B82|nr:molybdenum cofactor guanylyltransferase [Aurantiacibacter suaedae]